MSGHTFCQICFVWFEVLHPSQQLPHRKCLWNNSGITVFSIGIPMTFVKATVIPLKVNGIENKTVISLLFQWKIMVTLPLVFFHCYTNENTSDFSSGIVSLDIWPFEMFS